MKRIIIFIAFLLPLALNAQTKLTDNLVEDFSTKMAARYQLNNDSLTLFVTEQMTRSGAGGLDIDKTMTELKNDPAALDAALKFIYQFSDCNRQTFIERLRSMNLKTNSVFPLATYTVNKFKNETKDLTEEKATLYKSGAIPTSAPPRSAVAKAPAVPQPGEETSGSSGSAGSTSVNPGTVAQPGDSTASTSSAAPEFNWDVRTLFKLRQPQQLIEMYGQNNVVQRLARDLNGNETNSQAWFVFPDTDNEMQVIFNGERGNIITFTKEHSKWKSPFGIKVGDPLDKVIKVNGKAFKFNAFEWDNGGVVSDWDGGAIDGKGVALVLKATNSGDPSEYDKVTGDKKIKSDMPVLKKLDVVVDKVVFQSN
jgi:hypothetical protein